MITWELFYKKIITENIDAYILNPNNIKLTHEIINNYFLTFNIEYKSAQLNNFIIALTDESYIKKDYTDIKVIKNIFMYNETNILNQDKIKKIENTENIVPLQTECYNKFYYLGKNFLKSKILEYIIKRYKEGYNFDKLYNNIYREYFDKISIFNNYFTKYILVSNIYDNIREKLVPKIFISFIGALLYEIDYESCSKIILFMLEYIDFNKIVKDNIDTPFTIVHDYIIKTYKTYPFVNIVNFDKMTYKAKIYIENILIADGYGTSKQKAKDDAAMKIIELYNIKN